MAEAMAIERSPRLEQEEEEVSHLVMLLRVCLSECASIRERTWIQKYQKYRAAVWLYLFTFAVFYIECCSIGQKGNVLQECRELLRSNSSWGSFICSLGKIPSAAQRMYPYSPLKEQKWHEANGKHPTVLVVLNNWPPRRSEIFAVPVRCTWTPGSAGSLPFMYWVTWLLDLRNLCFLMALFPNGTIYIHPTSMRTPTHNRNNQYFNASVIRAPFRHEFVRVLPHPSLINTFLFHKVWLLISPTLFPQHLTTHGKNLNTSFCIPSTPFSHHSARKLFLYRYLSLLISFPF